MCYNFFMSSKKHKHSALWTNLLSLLAFIIVAIVIYQNLGDIETTLNHLRDTNLPIFLLLIPEQFVMLYAGGQIFFSFVKAAYSKSKLRQFKSPKPFEVVRITLEANFVRAALPSAGVSSAAYLSWRLKPYGFSAPQTSFIYLLRYFAIITFNQLQTVFAIFFILLFRPQTGAGVGTLILASLLAAGTALFLWLFIILISNPRRALWFTEKIVRFLNWLVRKITLGKKRKLADYETIKSFILEIHKTYTTAKENKNILKFPILWGAIYSFFEIATYWVVSISLGHPELLPEIMIGEAVGSIAGSIIPYGLYELGMAGAIASLGVDIGLAGLIVVITRVVSLGETFLFGHIFYQASMRTKPHES